MPVFYREAADVVTGPGNKHVIKVYADTSKHSLSAVQVAISGSIKVLKNPVFNSNEVVADMLQSLSTAIDSSGSQIISVRMEGDRAHNLDLSLFERQVDICVNLSVIRVWQQNFA